ncbi:MAG: pilus assembly PilX N-terminal domain-containing protein [Deinococcales bacterium]
MRQEKGITLVVTLLAIVLALVSVVTMTALSSLGTQKGAVNQRLAYQALLAAESGLNTFAIRAADYPYEGDGSLESLNDWLSDNALDTLVLDDDVRANLSFIEGSEDDIVSLEAAGEVGEARAIKQVLIDIAVEEGFSNLSARLGINVPAALTSVSEISVRGNGAVEGLDANGWDGTVQNIGQITNLLNATTITLDNAALFKVGDYVDVGLKRYQITAITDKTLSLSERYPYGSILPVNNLKLSLVSNALAAAATVSRNATVTIKVNHSERIFKGQVLYFGPVNSSISAEVLAVNYSSGEVQVRWGSNGHGISLSESTAVKASALGAASANDIGTKGQGDIKGGMIDNNPIAVPSGEALFLQTFGVSKQELLGTLGQGQRSGGMLTVHSASQLSSLLPISDIVYIRGDVHLTGNSGLCGRGILIVEGDVTLNGACSAGFTGLLYLTGNYRNQGNANIAGAVVTESGTDPSMNMSMDDTVVAGTGKGSSKIKYDPSILMNMSNDLKSLALEEDTGHMSLSVLTGTWRQR